MSASTLILCGAGIYIVALLVVGFLATRRVHDSTDFIVAGRRLPLWLCTFTLFATWFGAGTCIGAAGAAYGGGFLAVIADPFGAGLCLLIAGFFYVRFLRRMRLLTVPDFFRRRFGRLAELLAAFSVIPAYIGWAGSQFVAFGFILHTLTGIETTLGIVLGAVVVLVYTTAGGMWAVTMTDFVQGVILIIGLTILLPLALSAIGGVNGFLGRVPGNYFDLLPENTLKDWAWYIQAWLVIGLGNLPGQDLVQRALSAKDERVAQWSSYISAFMYFTVGMVPVVLGMIGAVLIPDIADPEFILIELGLELLPPVGMAVFVGALFSALMSSSDSALLAPASIFGQNILKHFKKDPSQRQLLIAIRWAVLGTGIVALMTALYFQRVYDLMVNSWSVLLVTLFVPITAGIYWKKTNTPGAVSSILVGTLSWLFLEWSDFNYPADLTATGLAIVTLVMVTLLTHKTVAAMPLTDVDGSPVDYRDRLGVLALTAERKTTK